MRKTGLMTALICSSAFICGTAAAVSAARSAALPIPMSATDQAGCSNTSLSGSYAYSFTGAGYLSSDGTPQPGGTRVDIVAVGIITYDAQGGFSGSDTISNAGTIRPRTFTGTYSLNADCTGTGTIVQATSTTHTAMVVAGGGSEIWVIVTDPGAAISGVAHKQ